MYPLIPGSAFCYNSWMWLKKDNKEDNFFYLIEDLSSENQRLHSTRDWEHFSREVPRWAKGFLGRLASSSPTLWLYASCQTPNLAFVGQVDSIQKTERVHLKLETLNTFFHPSCKWSATSLTLGGRSAANPSHLSWHVPFPCTHLMHSYSGFVQSAALLCKDFRENKVASVGGERLR